MLALADYTAGREFHPALKNSSIFRYPYYSTPRKKIKSFDNPAEKPYNSRKRM